MASPTAKKPAAKKAAAKKQTAAAAAPAAAKKAVPVKKAAAKPAKEPAVVAKKAPAKKGSAVLDKFLEGQRKSLLEERARLTRHSEVLKAEADSLALDREAGDTQFDEE